MVKAPNPYVRASALHGNPIVTNDGDTDFEVQDVLVDRDGRGIVGFSAREPGVFGKRHVGVVPLSGVSSIGPDAVMVKAGSVTDPPDEDDRLGTQLVGASVVTETGVEVGHISDLVLETRHNATRVRAVEVDPAKLPYSREGQKGSILEIALGNGVEIDHACGGVCACSTCHVVVRKGIESIPEATDDENDQLDNAPGLTPQSRLACQSVPDGTQDLVVEIPSWNRNLVKEDH